MDAGNLDHNDVYALAGVAHWNGKPSVPAGGHHLRQALHLGNKMTKLNDNEARTDSWIGETEEDASPISEESAMSPEMKQTTWEEKLKNLVAKKEGGGNHLEKPTIQ